MRNKNKKYWFIALAIIGLLYLVFSIFGLINNVKSGCGTKIGTILMPTIALICQTQSTFYVPFGLFIGLVLVIIGIYFFAKYSK